MSLEHFDQSYRQKITSPRSLIALCREGLAPEDLILEDKEHFIERVKNKEKGERMYQHHVEDIKYKAERALKQFQNVCANGISENEYIFMNRAPKLSNLISQYQSKPPSIQTWGSKNAELMRKNKLSMARRKQRDIEAEQYNQKQIDERNKYLQRLEERKKQFEENKKEEYEAALKKKQDKQRQIDEQQKQIWNKQVQLQEEMRRNDEEKREKQRQILERQEEERKQRAYEKQQQFLAKRSNIEQIRDQMWQVRQQQSEQLMNNLQMRSMKVQQERDQQHEYLRQKCLDNDRITQEKIVKAERAKQERLEKIRQQLEEKEQKVQLNLSHVSEAKSEKQTERKAKNVERTKNANLKLSELRDSCVKAQQEYYNMYTSKSGLKEACVDKRNKDILERTTTREIELGNRTQNAKEMRRQAEYYSMLKKIELDRNKEDLDKMLRERDLMANRNVQNSVRYSALKDLNPKEKEKLEKIFLKDINKKDDELDLKYSQPQVRSKPFAQPRRESENYDAQHHSGAMSRKGVNEAARQEARRQIEEMIIQHKNDMLQLVEQQQARERERLQVYKDTNGGAAMLAIQNEERQGDKRELEELENKQKQELKQAMFFYKKRFENM